MTLVLHTWGSALTHHPHVHGIVAGGGLALDGERWVRCRPGFFLPVRVLSRLFRRRFLEELAAAHRAGRLQFFGDEAPLADARTFAQWLAPLRECEWVVYAKRPFAGPAAVLAYLSRYTHRVAIANSRLLAFDERGVTFRWKDYRASGKTRYKAMTLSADEFIRRFLLHVLPSGFHRIRHYGLLANGGRREHLAQARELLDVPAAATQAQPNEAASVASAAPTFVCPHCGATMRVVEIFAPHASIRAPPTRKLPHELRRQRQPDVRYAATTAESGRLRLTPSARRFRRPRHRCIRCGIGCIAHQHALRRTPCARFAPSQLSAHRPNPHSGLASSNRSAVRRGFLPRGLCNACPRSSITTRTSARQGRHRTTLNNSAPPRLTEG